MSALDHVYFEGIARPPRPPGPVRAAAAWPQPDPAGAPPDEFLVWLLGRAGLPAERYRGRSLSRRLAACLRQVHARTPHEARRILERDPELLARALDSVLLGVTGFFRDSAVFAWIEAALMPALARADRPLRIWSAACSDGHELYSMAMLLAEHQAPNGADLLGTDLRASAIARASAGVYAEKDLETVPTSRRRRWFREENGRFRLVDELCAAVRWSVQDLFRGPSPGPWDVILWRNMAIYLAPGADLPVWRAFDSVLRPGGHFVTGKADTAPAELGWERVAPCVYRKPEVAP